jgi:hypothetical protein
LKLDALLEDFVDLGITATRTEQHAQTFDFSAMRRSWHMHESAAKQHAIGDPRREVAEKNLSVLRQRRQRYDDLTRTIQSRSCADRWSSSSRRSVCLPTRS